MGICLCPCSAFLQALRCTSLRVTITVKRHQSMETRLLWSCSKSARNLATYSTSACVYADFADELELSPSASGAVSLSTQYGAYHRVPRVLLTMRSEVRRAAISERRSSTSLAGVEKKKSFIRVHVAVYLYVALSLSSACFSVTK